VFEAGSWDRIICLVFPGNKLELNIEFVKIKGLYYKPRAVFNSQSADKADSYLPLPKSAPSMEYFARHCA
jgi:hypothetical protein